MDEIRNLEARFNEIIAGYTDLEEIGYDNLNQAWQQLDELKNRANQLAEDMLVGVTRAENGRFLGRNQIEFDIHEIAQLTTAVDNFTDRVYSEIHRINLEERHKKDMFMERGRRRNDLNRLIRTNNNMIATLNAEIKNIKTELGDPGLTDEMIADLAARGITFTPSPSNLSPERRYFLEQELAAKTASLAEFERANEAYRLEYERLTEEMGILKNGGRLPDRSEELENEEGLDQEEDRGLTPPTPGNGEQPAEEDEEEMIVPPVIPPVGGDEEPEEELPGDLDEPEDEEGLVPPIIPPVIPPVGGDEEPEEELPGDLDEPEDEEGLVPPIIPPIIPPVGGDEEPEEELPGDLDEPEDEEGLVPPVIPPVGGEEEPAQDEPDETPEEEEEEEDEVVAVVQPKQSLWKKIVNIIGMAIVALSALGTAHHTGMMIDDIENIAQVEEAEDQEEEEEEEEETPEETPEEETPEETPEQPDPEQPDPEQPDPEQPEPEQPEPEQPEPEQPEPEQPEPEQPEPEQPEPEQPEPEQPEPEQPEPEQPEPEQPVVPTEDDIVLGYGETAYDEETGVEVSRDGNAAYYGEDGTIEQQEDRDLGVTEQGDAVVTDEDLQRDEPVQPLPAIGDEVEYEVGVQDMPEEEREELDEAIAEFDWEGYFDQTYGEGNSLQP